VDWAGHSLLPLASVVSAGVFAIHDSLVFLGLDHEVATDQDPLLELCRVSDGQCVGDVHDIRTRCV
jgi:hypothetical protein